MNGSNPCFFSPRWPVFYEDNHLLVLYKPAGLLMQGDHTGDISLLDLAKDWIRKRYQKPGNVFLALVHRLDRPVAGVVLFCRTTKSAGRLSEQFRTHDLEKRYLAIVEGKIDHESGELVHHLERHNASSRVVPGPTEKSREARLAYKVLETDMSRSLVEIDLITGRHHQIRVQFSHMGFPVLGDMRYGASGPLPDKQIALFANRLTIRHPTLKKQLIFDCPLPEKWPWFEFGKTIDAQPWNWVDLQEAVMREALRT